MLPSFFCAVSAPILENLAPWRALVSCLMAAVYHKASLCGSYDKLIVPYVDKSNVFFWWPTLLVAYSCCFSSFPVSRMWNHHCSWTCMDITSVLDFGDMESNHVLFLQITTFTVIDSPNKYYCGCSC